MHGTTAPLYVADLNVVDHLVMLSITCAADITWVLRINAH